MGANSQFCFKSEIERALVHGQGRFLGGFAQTGVGVADACDVFGAGLELHGHHGLGDQFAGHGPDDVHAQDLVRGGVGQELDHAGRVAQRTRAAIRQEREGAGLVLDAVRLELLLGAAHPRDLGAGVDDPGNGVEVDMPVLAGDALGHSHALFFGLVRQHGAPHHVTHSPDAGQVGTAISVHHDFAALAQLQAYSLGVQADGVGHAANRDDQLVHVHAHGFTLGVGVGHIHALLAGLDVADLHAQLDLQALLVEGLLGFLGDLLVHGTQEGRQAFEHGHVGSQTAPDRAHLQADHARADHADLLAHQRLFSGARHLDLVATFNGFDEGATAVEEADLVLLEQVQDAIVVLLHNLVLAAHHLGHVHRHLAGADAVLGEVLVGVLEMLGRLQQRLGGDAAHVRAGAAGGRTALVVLPLVDAGHVEAQLRGADGADVAAGAAADDDDVELFAHGLLAQSFGEKPTGGPERDGPRGWVIAVLLAGSDIEQQARRIFQCILHGDQAQHGFTAVDDAVVVRHGQVVHRTDHDLAVLDHGAVLGGVHAQDGRLRRVDDGCGHHRAEGTAVGDGEGGAGHFLDAQLAFGSLLAEFKIG